VRLKDRRGPVAELEAEDQTAAPGRSGGLPRAYAVRATTFGLWGLVGLSALAGFAGLASRSAPATAAAVEPPPPSVTAEGFAEMFVSAYLGAGEENRKEALAPYYPPEALQRSDPNPATLYVARTATLAATEVDDGYWSITVGAEVLEPTAEGGYRPGGTRFYQVGVVEVDGALVATALPGQVPAPATAEAPELDVETFRRAVADEPTTVAMQRFFVALLAGDGELERYMAPGTGLRAVDPAPYAEVEVTRVAQRALSEAQDSYRAAVEVAVTDAAERTQVFHYALEVAMRDGRWEVTELLPAVPLDR
jgi:hypothetical protein